MMLRLRRNDVARIARNDAMFALMCRRHMRANIIEKGDCFRNRLFLAGAEGLEPATCGFGDRRSTN